MYINRISIQNIRSFESLEMDFGDSKAGWHVILGTNGTGKSTLIRSVALALVGAREAQPLTFRYSWKYWLRGNTGLGSIKLDIGGEVAYLEFKKNKNFVILEDTSDKFTKRESIFSAAYGSFRIVTGGGKDYDNIWNDYPKLAAHLTCFGEDIALDKSLDWLDELKKSFLQTEDGIDIVSEDGQNILLETSYPELLQNIENFINTSNLLPNNIKMSATERVFGIRFMDKNGFKLPIAELSDGYRSILSLVLELIRQLSRFHNNNPESFFVINGEYLYINTLGVVLIDEIDSHLHPTWQAQIGDWFTKYFPNIQFIVTTHSPIICRSATTGTIWELSNTEKSTTIEQIVGDKKNQLLYGNILDAYETDLFGEDISRSPESLAKLKRLARLNIQKQVGRITTEEEKELKTLQQIFQTDAQNTFFAD